MAQVIEIQRVEVGPEYLTARVRVADDAPLMTSGDLRATTLVYNLLPHIVDHVCLGDAGETFKDCMGATELAHLLEHMTVELLAQTNIAGDITSGKTYPADDDPRAFEIQLTCTDDVLTAGALASAVWIIDWAFTGGADPAPDVAAIVEGLRGLVDSLGDEPAARYAEKVEADVDAALSQKYDQILAARRQEIGIRLREIEAARAEAEAQARQIIAREEREAAEAARIERERREAEEAARIERERREAEEAARIERERREAEEAARIERERREAEEARQRAEAEMRRAREAANTAEVERLIEETHQAVEQVKDAARDDEMQNDLGAAVVTPLDPGATMSATTNLGATMVIEPTPAIEAERVIADDHAEAEVAEVADEPTSVEPEPAPEPEPTAEPEPQTDAIVEPEPEPGAPGRAGA